MYQGIRTKHLIYNTTHGDQSNKYLLMHTPYLLGHIEVVSQYSAFVHI